MKQLIQRFGDVLIILEMFMRVKAEENLDKDEGPYFNTDSVSSVENVFLI